MCKISNLLVANFRVKIKLKSKLKKRCIKKNLKTKIIKKKKIWFTKVKKKRSKKLF